jgi:hypothetical protein
LIGRFYDSSFIYSAFENLPLSIFFFVVKKLAKPGSYGGQECLVAFARIFKIVVYVHQPDDKITLQVNLALRRMDLFYYLPD